VPRDQAAVGPRDFRRQPIQCRNRHLVDQVAEKRRFREDFHIQKRRARLERNRSEGLGPVDAAGRMNIGDRHTEHPARRAVRQPTPEPPAKGQRAAADDVIGLVDGVQERLHVGIGPRSRRRGDDDQRHGRLGHGLFESAGRSLAKFDDDRFDGPAGGANAGADALGD